MVVLTIETDEYFDNSLQFLDDPRVDEEKMRKMLKLPEGFNMDTSNHGFENPNFDELMEWMSPDTEVMAEYIDKYWEGYYLVEFFDDNNNGLIRVTKIKM
jgi:hypothetical protein